MPPTTLGQAPGPLNTTCQVPAGGEAGKAGSGLWPSLSASFTPSLSYAFQHQVLHLVLGCPQMSEDEEHPDFGGGNTGNGETVLGRAAPAKCGGQI